MRASIATLFLFLVLSGFPAPAFTADLIVAADGTGPYATIQDALDDFSAGDAVVLLPGTYVGLGNRDFEIYDPITVRSFDVTDPAVIDCQGSAPEWHWGFQIEGGAISLEHLIVRNGFLPDGSAVIVNGGSVTLDHCVFENNTASLHGGAVAVAAGATVVASHCIFAENTAYVAGGAVYATGAGSTARLFNCTLFRNEAPDGSGLFRDQNADMQVNQSIIAFGIDGAAVNDFYGGGLTVGCTDIFANEGGDWTGALAGELAINNNANVDPMFCDPLGSPAHYGLMPGSPVGDAHPCGVLGAGATDPAWPAPVYGLMANGHGMYSTIQTAADAVPSGAVISLEDGTYVGLGNRDVDFAGKALSLTSRSGSAASVIIDLQGSAAFPARGFWLHSGETLATSISHLTIRNGHTDLSAAMPYPGSGGAILLTSGSDLTIVDVTFENNSADVAGAAIAIVGAGAMLDISGSRFASHGAGFCIDASGSGLAMDDCVIDETNFGGVTLTGLLGPVAVSSSQLHPIGAAGLNVVDAFNPVTADSCSFVARAGAASLNIDGAQDVTLSNSTFIADSSTVTSDPVVVVDSDVTFTGCSFSKADVGYPQCKAVGSADSILRFYACTFTDFTTNASGGVVNTVGGSLYLNGCEFNNNANGVYHAGPGSSGATVYGTTFNGSRGYCVDISNVDWACLVIYSEINDSVSGVRAVSVPDLTIQDTDFNNNPTGPTMALFGSTAAVTDCLFTGNGTDARGGAIYGNGSVVTITGCGFTNNSSATGGGALASVTGSFDVYDSTFLDNRSDTSGGAFHGDDATARFFTCRFENNSSLLEGGAIYQTLGSAAAQDTKFLGNSSVEGGAVAGFQAQLTFEGCEITGNSATGEGGIHLVLCTPVLVDRCLVANNTSSFLGSGIGVNQSDLAITSSTIASNGGAGSTGQVDVASNSCTLDITASLICFGTDSPAVFCSNPQFLTLTTGCVDVFGNSGGDWVGPLAGLQGVGDNFSLDPEFCDLAAGVFTLAYTSPCTWQNNACGSDIGAYSAACSGASGTPENELPSRFAVLGNVPNPFNPRTDIAFEMPTASPVRLTIYDASGRLVRRLIQGERYEPGSHRVTWDGSDDAGRGQSSGVYFYRVQTQEHSLGGKMALVR